MSLSLKEVKARCIFWGQFLVGFLRCRLEEPVLGCWMLVVVVVFNFMTRQNMQVYKGVWAVFCFELTFAYQLHADMLVD